MTQTYRVSVDIGGTFTDTVLMRGAIVAATAKTLTTHDDPARGARQGLNAVLSDAAVPAQAITGVIHGTTLATNALIERRGAVVSAVTTDGFRDILEIAYERRYSQYDINIDKPDLIVPRHRCFTVPERMSVQGHVLRALDDAGVDDLADSLSQAGTEALAICLLHSYANPAHEQQLGRMLRQRLPDLAISLSSQVSPEAREFDRLCTTVANAYVQPLMQRYLERFASAFRAEGVDAPVLMMTAGGGMTTLETAAAFPIRLVESGPAGGAILAGQVARQCGATEVLSFDMGGTTAKLCLIDAYTPQTARQFEIARAERFIKGSGMPVRIPVVDMIEIGAGGGSIAGVDRLGRLTVGPESAGSDPGPAAFMRGGRRATVTDADVAQGLIDPDRFAEGRLQINADAAVQAIGADLKQMGLPAAAEAPAISELVDENMANAGRMHAVESGKDLGTRTMIAFGGNGPLHATRVARRSGVGRIIVPPSPGVGSAVGFLYAPVAFEIIRSLYMTLDDMDFEAINTLFDDLQAETASVVEAGAPGAPMTRRRVAFMRYRGQGHEIEVPLPDRPLTPDDLPGLRSAYEDSYRQQFNRTVPGMTIEILNWSFRASGPEMARLDAAKAVDGPHASPETHRAITCDVTGQDIRAAVHPRTGLAAGARVEGPALIVEPQTTTLVSADFVATVDSALNLHLTRRPR